MVVPGSNGCWNDVSLSFRDVDFFADIARWRDGEDLAMVGLDCVKTILISNQAIEDSVGFKVEGVGVHRRVLLQELAEVGDHAPASCTCIDARDEVRSQKVSVRAPSAGGNCVELTIEE